MGENIYKWSKFYNQNERGSVYTKVFETKFGLFFKDVIQITQKIQKISGHFICQSTSFGPKNLLGLLLIVLCEQALNILLLAPFGCRIFALPKKCVLPLESFIKLPISFEHTDLQCYLYLAPQPFTYFPHCEFQDKIS